MEISETIKDMSLAFGLLAVIGLFIAIGVSMVYNVGIETKWKKMGFDDWMNWGSLFLALVLIMAVIILDD